MHMYRHFHYIDIILFFNIFRASYTWLGGSEETLTTEAKLTGLITKTKRSLQGMAELAGKRMARQYKRKGQEEDDDDDMADCVEQYHSQSLALL